MYANVLLELRGIKLKNILNQNSGSLWLLFHRQDIATRFQEATFPAAYPAANGLIKKSISLYAARKGGYKRAGLVEGGNRRNKWIIIAPVIPRLDPRVLAHSDALATLLHLAAFNDADFTPRRRPAAISHWLLAGLPSPTTNISASRTLN